MTGLAVPRALVSRWCGDRAPTFRLEEDADAFRKTSRRRWPTVCVERANAVTATKVDARKLRVAEWCQEFYAPMRDERTELAPYVGVTLSGSSKSQLRVKSPGRSERSAMRRWITRGCGTSPQLVLWSNTLTPALRARRGDAQAHRRTPANANRRWPARRTNRGGM